MWFADHAGHTRAIYNGTPDIARSDFLPYGIRWNNGQAATSRYQFTGYEDQELLDRKYMNAGARFYNGRIFNGPDPLAKDYLWISPYAYCLNNPIRLIDFNGMAPGDPFKTKHEAAKDWGKYYNGVSIVRGIELGSTIYEMRLNGKIQYTYTEAQEGSAYETGHSFPANGEPAKALIHSHGKYDGVHNNNSFSEHDYLNSFYYELESYLATPNGSLKTFNPSTSKDQTISTDLPSDPKDPTRKNEIKPEDRPMPMDKVREQTTREQDKKPVLEIPEWQKNKIKWAF